MKYSFLLIILIFSICCSDSFTTDSGIHINLPPFDIAAKTNIEETNTTIPDTARDIPISESEVAEDFQDDTYDTSKFEDISEDEHLFDGDVSETEEINCPSDIIASARYMHDLHLLKTESSYLNGVCDAVRYSVVMSADMEFSFYIRGDYLKPMVIMSGPGRERNEQVFIKDSYGLPLIFSFRAEKTGEYFLTLTQVDRKRRSPYYITMSCNSSCERLATRYPIVMVHGFSGFKNIGPIEYFYRVPETLTSMGYDVHIAKLDPYNSTEVRGPQLKGFIEEVLDKTGAYKVNLIAHSQGGLDSRYVISGLMMADRIGALITIATPHYGTPLADYILSDPTGVGKAALDAMLTIMGAALDSESRANAMASLRSLSVAYVTQEFNKRYPDDKRVRYFSYTGRTCWAWEDCGDTVDTEIALTYGILRSQVGDNDGIVPTDSGIWGEFLGVLKADHFDEVGQVAGVTNENFNHIEFYKGLAELLRREGF
jgi:triacylglycerol esterase/lipase EstA (alpha/beta hydrolase family)